MGTTGHECSTPECSTPIPTNVAELWDNNSGAAINAIVQGLQQTATCVMEAGSSVIVISVPHGGTCDLSAVDRVAAPGRIDNPDLLCSGVP